MTLAIVLVVSLASFWAIYTQVCTICSFLHSVLPPFDWAPDFLTVGLKDFPRAQRVFRAVFQSRWYKLLIYVVGYVALNARSTVWKSISMPAQIAKQNGPNAANGAAAPQVGS